MKNNTGRIILIGTGLALVLVVAVVAVNWKWPELITGEPKYETPALSADYLPSDTSSVLHVNLRETQDSPYVKKEFGAMIRQQREQFVPRAAQEALGVDAEKDIDWVRVAVTSGDPEHPFILLGGKFDPAKFKVVEQGKGLKQVNKAGDRYRLYELPIEQGNTTLTFTLAPAEGMLILCDKALRVTDALEDTAVGRKPVLQDAALVDLLKKVDRKQSIWGASAGKSIKQVPPLSITLAEAQARLIRNNADGVYGGVACGNDLRGEVVFLSENEEKASSVESGLKGLKALAAFPFGIPGEWKPLLAVIKAGEVSRDGKTVTVRSQLSEKKQ